VRAFSKTAEHSDPFPTDCLEFSALHLGEVHRPQWRRTASAESFGAFLDPEQHLSLHQERCGLHRQHPDSGYERR